MVYITSTELSLSTIIDCETKPEVNFVSEIKIFNVFTLLLSTSWRSQLTTCWKNDSVEMELRSILVTKMVYIDTSFVICFVSDDIVQKLSKLELLYWAYNDRKVSTLFLLNYINKDKLVDVEFKCTSIIIYFVMICIKQSQFKW